MSMNSSQLNVSSARLIHQGGMFECVKDRVRYKGLCRWTWNSSSHDGPRAVYVLRIEVRSIARTGIAVIWPLSSSVRAAVAREAVKILNNEGYEVALDDTYAPARRRICCATLALRFGPLIGF